MSISSLRERFTSATSSFSLHSTLIPKNSHEDSLMASARRYYLLLPAAAAGLDWSEVPKQKRRKIIREHLETVCCSVSTSNVKEVDLWLSSMSSPREQLLLYGRKLQARYGRLCFICGKHIKDDLTVDHIFPYSRGGLTHIENLILAHRRCNSAKGKALPGEMLKWAPEEISCAPEDIEVRLRYLVFLRDEFSCQNKPCSNSLFNGHEIQLTLKSKTGIACYDNLETRCSSCSSKEKHT
jgi:5-methylcytosine-specific restriction endonuclease McrA